MPKRANRIRTTADSPSEATSHPLFRVALAVSLDGYIAAPDGGVKWLEPFFTPEIDFMGFAKTIGITVWGRATYEQSLTLGYGGGGGGRVVVLTHRPLPGNTPAGVEGFHGDVRSLAPRLREELAGTGKDIWLGGGGLSILPFHEAGLVDRWELSFMPTLLGDGIPLFPKCKRTLDGLELVKTRALSNGIVEMHYAPARVG